MRYGRFCDLVDRIGELESENRVLRKEIDQLVKKHLEEEAALERKYLAEIHSLEQKLEIYRQKLSALDESRKLLERRANMNSSNSSKPPSTDGFRRPRQKSLREKTNLKQGGQAGHPGNNMTLPHEPDELVMHYPEKCTNCSNFTTCLKNSAFSCGESRFVVDVVIDTKVTEHRIMKIDNSNGSYCQMSSDRFLKGTFPEDVKAYVQYGNSLTSLVTILSGYGFMSYGRITGLLRDLTGLTISSGTAVSMVSRCAEKVAPAITDIRKRLLESKVTNNDETGVHINGKINWVHSTSNSRYVFQTVSTKRGKEGVDEHGFMPEFNGTAIHDCWGPYFTYGSDHGLCCAHLLRELRGIQELEPSHTWSEAFALFLVSLNKAKKSTESKGGTGFDPDRLERISGRYDELLSLADNECPPLVDTPSSGMKKRKGPERSLIERLRKYKDYVCHFVTDFDIPFDNNQAERDVRYAKVKMKVSGQFRDKGHAQEFLDIISYIGTARKNGISAFKSLNSAFSGNTDIIFG